MNPPTIESSAHLITLLASLMLVLQLLLAVQTMLVTNIRLFARSSVALYPELPERRQYWLTNFT